MSGFTVFAGHELRARGSLASVALAAKAAHDAEAARLVIFDDEDGRQVELDLRGTLAEVVARLETGPPQRGRPRLGVTSREVTLLPRHWEWLARQHGGASAALRRLVDDALKSPRARRSEALDTAHRILFALAGDLAGFEEFNRAMYASDWDRAWDLIATWPPGVRTYLGEMMVRIRATESNAGAHGPEGGPATPATSD